MSTNSEVDYFGKILERSLKNRRIKELANVIRKESMKFTAKISFSITIGCCYENSDK